MHRFVNRKNIFYYSIRKVPFVGRDDPSALLVFAVFFGESGGPSRPTLHIFAYFANRSIFYCNSQVVIP